MESWPLYQLNQSEIIKKIEIMSSGKVVLGLLAGVAAGALAGILFAPAKGSKTRKRILRKGEDLVDDLKDKFDDLLEVVTKKVEKVKEDVSDYAEKVKTDVTDFAEKKMAKTEEAIKNAKNWSVKIFSSMLLYRSGIMEN